MFKQKLSQFYNWKYFVIVLFVIAFLIRFRYVFTPGYEVDMRYFFEWSKYILDHGIAQIYHYKNVELDYIADYPPVYYYVLLILGNILQIIGWGFTLAKFTILIKFTNLCIDLFTGLLLFKLLSKQQNRKLAIISLVVYLFNPQIFYNSAIWGQIDNFALLFIIGSIYLLDKKHLSSALTVLAIGVLAKFQNLIFLPFFAIYLVRKYDFKTLVINLLPAVIACLLILLPFIASGNLPMVVNAYFGASARYPYPSLYAYNFWWLWVNPYNARAFMDSVLIGGVVSYRLVGTIITLGLFSIIAFMLWKKPNKKLFLAALPAVVAVFFVFMTQMHERYLYALFPVFILVLWEKRSNIVIFIIAAISSFFNLVYVFPPSLAVGGFLRRWTYPYATYIIALFNLFLIGYLLWQYWNIYKNAKITKLIKPE